MSQTNANSSSMLSDAPRTGGNSALPPGQRVLAASRCSRLSSGSDDRGGSGYRLHLDPKMTSLRFRFAHAKLKFGAKADACARSAPVRAVIARPPSERQCSPLVAAGAVFRSHCPTKHASISIRMPATTLAGRKHDAGPDRMAAVTCRGSPTANDQDHHCRKPARSSPARQQYRCRYVPAGRTCRRLSFIDDGSPRDRDRQRRRSGYCLRRCSHRQRA